MTKSRKAIPLLITPILAGSILSADTKTVTKSTTCITQSLPADLIPVRDCSERTVTRYAKDENERTEIRAPATTDWPAFYTGSITTNQGVMYNLDFNARAYTKHTPLRFRPFPGLEPDPALPPPPIGHPEFGLHFLLGREPAPTSKTTDVYQETIDTGERKESFGQTAHHLILRTRIVPQPGAREPPRTVQREGWYIPVEAPRSFIGASSGIGPRSPKSCVDKYQIHGRFPYLRTMAETDELGNKREILEISHAPIDPKLFEPPPGFKIVDKLSVQRLLERHFTFDQRLAFEINSMVRELTSWFH